MNRFPLFLAAIFAVAFPSSGQEPNKPNTAQKGMVVSVSPAATDVGVEILKKGGSAVDAAVAVALAEAVTHPGAGNIGGGGFMVVAPGDGRAPTCFDYREKAPLKIAADSLAAEKNMLNHRAVGVPGTVRGLELAHKKFGKLPWREVALPAVALAESGFPLTQAEANSLNTYLNRTKANAGFQKYFGKPDSTKWQAGDRLVQKDLGAALRAIAEKGPDAFYTGPLADLFVAEMQRGKGWITHEDLKAYAAVERKPLQGSYRGFEIIGMPPPSSGGACIIQMLNVLENFDLKKMGRYSPQANHLVIEAMRRAFRDRAEFIGDPDFVPFKEELISKAYAKQLIKGIDPAKATRSLDLKGDIEIQGESNDTTHFSVIDADGMAVSNTYTLEEIYGSRVVVDGAGFLLNNEMGDFNTQPGVTNAKGRIGTVPNRIQPGKRMLSSMSPTIVRKEGKAFLVTGSPGGRTIINTTLNVILNVVDFDMDVQAAVDAPRFHHQWLPDKVTFEKSKDPKVPELIEGLKKMGHDAVMGTATQGDAHSIWIDPLCNLRRAGVDHRIDGKGNGY